MIVNPTDDFIGTLLAEVFRRELESEKKKEEVSKWKISMILDTDYYPVSIEFNNGISIIKGVIKDPDITMTTSMQTIIDITRGKTSALRAIRKGELRVKGLFRHPRSAFRLYRFMIPALEG
ncbi:MAG: hypothetical protein BAJATHORv1_60037 [Candidatus Thorarchaeota archaeon]|nr:MAG: hypothetical protein BAJATHORv1_60037 [Candidatus Thorarchaeota archaeon]